MEQIREILRLGSAHLVRAEGVPWIQETLTSLGYETRSRAEKGEVRAFLVLTTGYSRAQVERYIRQHRTAGGTGATPGPLPPAPTESHTGGAITPPHRPSRVRIPLPALTRTLAATCLLGSVLMGTAFLSALAAAALVECRSAATASAQGNPAAPHGRAGPETGVRM